MLIHLKTVVHKAALLSMVLSLLGFTVALALPGDPDNSFGANGVVTTYVVPSNPNRSDTVYAIAIQPNGKIVAAGDSYVDSTGNDDFAVTRHNTSGSLDTTFSGDGRLITNFGETDQAYDVAVQSDGKIIAAGRKCNIDVTVCDVALARYNPSGALDITFSGDGKQITDFGGVYAGGDNGSNGGLAIQSNGKIVVAGYMWNGTDYDLAVYRYNANGSPDTTFSGDGMGKLDFGSGRQDFASDLVIQTDGKIVIAGYTGDASFSNNNFAIARLNANGTADLTFSGDGRQTTNFNGDDLAFGLALQPNGKIVVVGQKNIDLIQKFAIARYNADGNLDTSFNGAGAGRKEFLVTPGAVASRARAVIVQTDGKIVVFGFNYASGNGDFALVRLNSGGGFDNTLSDDGKVTVDFGGYDFGLALARQPSDGKYVVGGFTNGGEGGVDFALARILP